MEFFKTMAGKVVAGIVALAVILSAISWWRMDPATRAALVHGTGKIVAWAGILILLPWASFFVIAWVARLESNLAGATLVVVYTLGEVVLLLWLFGWSGWGSSGWTFVALGGLLAAVYNTLTCDWIAEKVT